MFESFLETLKSYSLVGPLLVAAPIALFAIAVTFYFQWWRNRKSLSYEVLTSTNLFSLNSDVKHRVEVTLDGKPVKDVQLVIIEISNDGFVPIEDKDFSTLLTIDFGEKSEILSVENKDNHPEDLPVKFSFEKTKIEIEPLLLNRKDSMKLQVLINNFDSFLKVSARIKGVSEISDRDISVNFFKYLWKRSELAPFISSLGLVCITGFGLYNMLGKFPTEFGFGVVLFYFFIGCLLLLSFTASSLIFYQYYNRRSRKKT